MQPSFAPRNVPSLAGREAAPGRCFGPSNRYRVVPVHTRFDAVSWFVTDAESRDDADLPAVVRQAGTFQGAVAGLAD